MTQFRLSNILKIKRKRLLILLSELSSQFGRNLTIVLKLLPPGYHYMTGEDATIWVDIYPNEPVQVIQSVQGNFIGILDRMGYIRPIQDRRNKNIKLLQPDHYQDVVLKRQSTRRDFLFE